MAENRWRAVRAAWLTSLGAFCLIVGWIQAGTTNERILSTVVGLVFVVFGALVLRGGESDAKVSVIIPALAVIAAIVLLLI